MIRYDSIDELFENSTKLVFELEVVSDENKLFLYGLYKQATLGNNKTTEPSMLNFKGKAKWKAWKKQSGKGKSRAKLDYVDLVNQLFDQKTG